MCALRKRMLLQGRMYVFSRHVCFQCNLFGYHKVKVCWVPRYTQRQ